MDTDVGTGLLLQFSDERRQIAVLTVACDHPGSNGVDVATKFVTPLMNVANDSTSLVGQYPAQGVDDDVAHVERLLTGDGCPADAFTVGGDGQGYSKPY